MLGQIGCDSYASRVVSRGLAQPIIWEEMPFTSLAWGRVLDDTSQGQVQVDGLDPGCVAKTALSQVVTFEHELVFYRGSVPVWLGPVTNLKATGPRCVISGRDRSCWWDRRFIHANYAILSADLAAIFLTYFNDAMSTDPVAGFTCTVTPTGIAGSRSTLALDHKPAGGEMREIATVGIDWTINGPVCVAGGRTIPTAQVPVITDDHLRSDPDVEQDGLVKVNRQIITGGAPVDPITGQTINGPNIFGEARDATRQARDGLIEMNTQDDRALDSGSATAGALSTIALLGDGANIVSSLDLGANAPMTIDQLVPGAIIDVELTRPALPVSGFYRIQAVNVQVDTNGERVSIDVQPIGTT